MSSNVVVVVVVLKFIISTTNGSLASVLVETPMYCRSFTLQQCVIVTLFY